MLHKQIALSEKNSEYYLQLKDFLLSSLSASSENATKRDLIKDFSSSTRNK
jgi:hypothetical protein